jgi:hypothetical protein
MRLSRRPEPFDSGDYIFELKIDGFRSLGYIENGQCDLVSRNGNTFRNFKDLAQWIGGNLRVENAVLDGREIACVDDSGRSLFNDLLFRRRECVFFAFDLLILNGEDRRALPLIERKARLKQLLRRKRPPRLYVDHIEARGRPFFEKVCELDLEGIVAKRKTSAYRATEKPSPSWDALCLSCHKRKALGLSSISQPRTGKSVCLKRNALGLVHSEIWVSGTGHARPTRWSTSRKSLVCRSWTRGTGMGMGWPMLWYGDVNACRGRTVCWDESIQIN